MHLKKDIIDFVTRCNSFIEDNQFMRLGAYLFHFFGIIILIATGYQIMIQLSDRSREIEVREASHRHLLRESLFSPIPGSSGKGAALQQLLLIENATLSGLDLSCERVSGGWDEKELSCRNPVVLWDVDFQEIYNASLEQAQEQQLAAGVAEYGIGMDRLNFTGVRAHGDFSYISAENASLTAANFSGSALYQSDILGDFKRFNCDTCDLGNSDLRGNFTDAVFDFSAINNTRFIGKISQASLKNSWAWADALPMAIQQDDQNNLLGIEKNYEIDVIEQKRLLEEITICDPQTRINAGVDPWSSVNEITNALGSGFESECVTLSVDKVLEQFKDENDNIVQALKKSKM